MCTVSSQMKNSGNVVMTTDSRSMHRELQQVLKIQGCYDRRSQWLQQLIQDGRTCSLRSSQACALGDELAVHAITIPFQSLAISLKTTSITQIIGGAKRAGLCSPALMLMSVAGGLLD